ncbi:MAG: peptidoglycan glycosyltransferase [Sulfobacillus thermosulfidooxidans]|nr:MAG: peptidoglycan glycosyltransferase [Sulfobacillus thermosulfidooxidans]
MAVLHQKPADSPDSHHSAAPKKGWWILVGAATVIVGLTLFYSANWSGLTHLPQLTRQRLRQAHAPWTSFHQISPWFSKALVATEDRTFYTNWGISFEGIARAAWVDLQTDAFTQGGSTITQQLIRDLLLSPVKTIPRKITGVLLSLMATQLYSKKTLLTLYMNEVYLGDHAYGIGQAARNYFGIAPSQLTLPEASLLAGLPQAPSLYDPFVHFRLAKKRQLEVLNSMVQDHMISAAQAKIAYRAPLPLTGSHPA